MIATRTLRALAEALGLAPREWSERQILMVLRRANAIEPLTCRFGDNAGRDPVWREPGWLETKTTVATKVARTPAIPFNGVRWPAVELAVVLESQADDIATELSQACNLSRREQRRDNARIDALARAMHATLAQLARVRSTRAYAAGIRYLAREFAWCARMDPAFYRWATDAET